MRFCIKKNLWLLLLISIAGHSFAQDKSNRGKEFWLGYGFHWIFLNPDLVPANSQEMALYISAEQAATVTVSINGTAWSQTLSIPANTVDASILIPKTGANDARLVTDGLSTKGIHIVSDVPVAVYAHVYVNQGSGATMLMPVETYGYSYYSVNYRQNTSASPLPTILPTIQNGPDWYSWFYVVASEDNTRIEIVPSDTTKNGWLPGQTYTVNLNKGEIYNVFGKMVPGDNRAWAASKDMTGSKIKSVVGADGNCHPMAVFSGSGGIRICRGDGGEYMQQQVFPAQAWGTRYLTYHTINNTSTDILETNRNYYRVCVSDPSAVVKRNGVVLTGLNNNFFYEFQDSTGGDYIQSDKPILVSQYTVNENQCWNFPTTTPSPPSNGDPEMFYLSPIEQGQKAVRFYASRQSPAVSYVYTNIILPTTGVASLRVDGAALPGTQIIPHPNNSSYSVALARFIGPAAQHTIASDSAFTATVYGLGNYESYGYNVGTLINNLNHYGAIRNVFNTTTNIDTFTCPKTPVRLFVKLGYQATSIHWKLSQVTGITPNADSIINNPVPVTTELINGRTYYIYTLQQDFTFSTPGTYFIPVSFTSIVIENCSQTEYAQVKVVVKPGPVSDFNFSNPSCLADSVRFTGAAIPGVFNLTNYLWSFDDNSSLTTMNAVKKFITPGTQNVRYRIYADNGCAGDTTKLVNIFDTPVANFSTSGNICQSDSVRLTDNSTITIPSVVSWQWNYGDGNTSTRNTGVPFYHRYAAPGNYTISLIANSDHGCLSDTAFQTVTVFPSPASKFGYSGNICVGDSILLSDSSTSSSGVITTWEWNFSDGNSPVRNNNSNFYHTYNATGAYVVTLRVVSSNGCISNPFTRVVNVNSKPVANFNGAGVSCIDSLHRFTSTFAAGVTPVTWYWDFGDGLIFNSTTTNTASHVYSSALTNITVKHVVSVGQGCTSDTASFIIPVIHPNPVASFSITADTLCVNKPVLYNSNLTGIANWNWNFGNGTGSTAPPFNRPYVSANTYNISLSVVSIDGCGSLPATNTITINANPVLNAGPDKFIAPGTSVTLDATLNNPANYNLTWTPSQYLSNATILNPVSTPPGVINYTIQAVDKTSNCTARDNVTVNIITGLFIPTAFTPNNDGKNDLWMIPGLAIYPDALVSIFNRNGEIVYQSKDYYSRPWNGNFKGLAQPSSTFVYLIHLNDTEKRVLKGTLMLIR
jgi:gliding motility-associated-like protein